MAYRNAAKSSAPVDPFASLPAPSLAHAKLISAFIAQAKELIVSAYMPANGTQEERRAAAFATIQQARPTFTDSSECNSTDICFVLRKVHDKCVQESQDIADRASIAAACDGAMGLQRKLRANLTPEEVVEAGLSDTVPVPLTTVATAECFKGVEESDILPRLTVGRKANDGKEAVRGLGYEAFKKGDAWFVRVPYFEAAAPTSTDTQVPEVQAA